MKLGRLSTGRLMKLVAIVALNLCAGRILYSIEPWILAGAAPMALILEFAAYRMICSGGRARVFWAGFVIAGFLAVGSFIWGVAFHESVNVGINVVTGERMTITKPGLASGDRAWKLWEGYIDFVVDKLQRLPVTRGIMTAAGYGQVIGGTVIALLPQLLAALAGGLLALLLTRPLRFGARREPALVLADRI